VEPVEDGRYVLKTLDTFDREKQKSYNIPIRICDHKKLCNVSILLLTIGDVNDNPMAPGYSDIFVYNYEGKAPDTQVSMSQNLSSSPTAWKIKLDRLSLQKLLRVSLISEVKN
jgi:hypothetical protein